MAKRPTVISPAMRELAKRLEQEKAPKFSIDNFCFDKQKEFLRSDGRFKVACTSTRAGKCLVENTKVKTPTGYKYIQDMKIGDLVYGVNTDGSVSLTPVKQVYNQGVQTVVDLKHYGVTIATSTENHRWLFYRAERKRYEMSQLNERKYDSKLAYKNVNIPGGSTEQKYAYVLGALLGDGCAREHHLSISGEDNEIVSKIESIIGHTATKNSEYNFTWNFKNFDREALPFYNQWMHKKYAHEKICDYDIIKTWTRESQVEFLSGLIDTDGSVHVTKDGRVVIRLSMQAKSVIDCAKSLFEDLFQARPNIRIDNREKYKNGPVYNLVISNNKFALPILKELKTVCKRKQYKPEYNLLGQDESDLYIGFTISEPYQAQCWDIELENETHLYLLNNGLVTHNTNSIVAHMIETCITERDVVVAYFTISANSARNIIWGDLKKILEDYNINCDINETTMRVKFKDTRSEIRINGANNESEIEKVRGWKLRAAYVDEAQSFRGYLKYFIESILMSRLRDQAGTLIVTGTPGPVPSGFFYDIYHNENSWKKFHWTCFDNPHMRNLEQVLAEERAAAGITEEDPSYQREVYGRWVQDKNSLVFQFNRDLNVATTIPEKLEYIFGVDFGYKDSDAIAVIGYNESNVYLVEELITAKQNISELAGQIKVLQERYKPTKIVYDGGALGLKIGMELQQRHGLYMQPADKARKIEFIELLNDDLRTGRFKAFPNSRFEEDCGLLLWDKSVGSGKRVISESYHSDVNDAALYSWREAKHFLNAPAAPEKPALRSLQQLEDQVSKESAEVDAAKRGEILDDNVSEDDLMSIFDIYGGDF